MVALARYDIVLDYSCTEIGKPVAEHYMHRFSNFNTTKYLVVIKDYFDILDVSIDATWTDIEEAYRDQQRVWDPNRFQNEGQLRARAELRQEQLARAWHKLRFARSLIERYGDGVSDTRCFLEQYERCRPALEKARKKANSAKKSGTVVPPLSASKTSEGLKGKKLRKAPSQRVRSSRRRKVRVERRRKFARANEVEYFIVGLISLLLLSSIGLYHSQPSSAPIRIGVAATASPAEAVADALGSPSKVVVPTMTKGIPLIEAARLCQIPRIVELLSEGADVNVRDAAGLTPLMWAARSGCPKVVATLVAAGANKRARSDNGYSARDWARLAEERESTRMLQN